MSASLESIAAQVAAVNLKFDAQVVREQERDVRISSVEIVAAAILQALTKQQMPMLGTILEALTKLQDAASGKEASFELAEAMRIMADRLNEVVGSNVELTKAVREFPEMVVLASGGGVDLPDAKREPPVATKPS